MSAAPGESKSLLTLAWPLVISFTFRALLTSIDIPYASRVGDAGVAAIGLFFPLEFAFIACWVGSSTALTSHLSRAMGERHEGRIRQLVRTTTGVVACVGLFFLGVAAATWALSDDLGLDSAVAEAFGVYAPVAMAGIALVAFWSVIPDSIIKAHHDTRSTMIAGLLSGFTNLTLNTVFVFGFDLGMFGIGLATGLARLTSLGYALWRARSLEAGRRARWATLEAPAPVEPQPGLDAEGLFERPLHALLVLGVPSALTYVLMGSESFLVNAILARFDQATAAIAAFAIYHRAALLVLMPIIAVGVAVLPFVARLVGEGRPVEARSQLYRAMALAIGYVVLVAAPICVLGAGPLAGLLAKADATEALATFAIRYGAPLGALVAIPFLLSRPAFEALQRGGPGLVMATVRYLLLAAPLAYVGARVAERQGLDPFYGLIGGLLFGTGVTGVAFLVWLVRTLGALDGPTQALKPAEAGG